MKFVALISLWCALLCIEGTVGQQFGRLPIQQYPGVGRGGGRFGQPVVNCPTFCTAIYTPTCGFNGYCYKSFANPCELGNAACTGQGNFRQVSLSMCSGIGVRLCQ